jgi:hypothetical protein
MIKSRMDFRLRVMACLLASMLALSLGTPRTTRVTPTWIKNGKDWQIIGGMSMPEATVRKHD